MICHSIRVAFKPDVTQEQIDHAMAHLARMGREIEAVDHFCVGRDVGGEFTHGAMFALRTIDDYRDYMLAPIHREMDDIGLPLVATMISQDVTDDEDPQIAEKIQAIHAARFADDPELLKLVEDLPSYQGSGVPDQSRTSA